jgi:hypothetical protein
MRAFFVALLLSCSLPGLLACSDSSDRRPAPPFYDIEVLPTGDVSADTANLEAALAQGGTIYLRASNEAGETEAFELGGNVLQIERDIVLVGEQGGDQWTGEGMPRIVNSRLESHIPGTRIEIRGLHFVDSVNGAVDIRAGHDVTILGNRVTAATMQGQGIHEVVVLPLQTVAVNVGGELYDDPLGHTHSYADVTGTVRIEDNYANTEEAGVPLDWPVDKQPLLNDPEAAFSYQPTPERIASWLAWREVAWHTRHFQVVGAAADVVISGNRSLESPGIGIMMINGHGTIDIVDNEVELSEASDYYISGASAGIAFFDSDVAGEHASEERVNIEANRITTRGVFQCGVAFYDWIVRAQEMNIIDNEITLSPTAGDNPLAFGFYGGNASLELTGNSVDGEGDGGVWLDGELDGHSADSDFTGLESSRGDFMVRGEVIPESMYQDLDLGSL